MIEKNVVYLEINWVSEEKTLCRVFFILRKNYVSLGIRVRMSGYGFDCYLLIIDFDRYLIYLCFVFFFGKMDNKSISFV